MIGIANSEFFALMNDVDAKAKAIRVAIAPKVVVVLVAAIRRESYPLSVAPSDRLQQNWLSWRSGRRKRNGRRIASSLVAQTQNKPLNIERVEFRGRTRYMKPDKMRGSTKVPITNRSCLCISLSGVRFFGKHPASSK
jgi:hypothetical protein